MSKPTLGGELMFPSDYVSAVEFRGKDVTLTIAKVSKDELQLSDGTTESKPVLRFKETKKKLVLNKTNAVAIAGIHGNQAEKWEGKQITLYPTHCRAFGQIVDCIRVREPARPSVEPELEPEEVGDEIPW